MGTIGLLGRKAFDGKTIEQRCIDDFVSHSPPPHSIRAIRVIRGCHFWTTNITNDTNRCTGDVALSFAAGQVMETNCPLGRRASAGEPAERQQQLPDSVRSNRWSSISSRSSRQSTDAFHFARNHFFRSTSFLRSCAASVAKLIAGSYGLACYF